MQDQFSKIKVETEKILTETIKLSERIIPKDESLILLENEKEKLESLEFTLAFIGTMKAGKSTTINAIVGQEILPHRVEAMTTLPTLVTHTRGQKKPILLVPSYKVFNKLLKQCRSKHSSKDKTSHDYIYDKSLDIKKEYTKNEEIFRALKIINDLMRFAIELEIEPPFDKLEKLSELPRIEVEFYYLQGEGELNQARFSLLDTPGPNEHKLAKNLKNISKTQTDQASAVMLVTDYTQISGEKTAEMKQQVYDALAFVGADKVFFLLNKFDEDRKQGASKKGYEGAQEFFSKDLLNNKFDSSKVFPISSRDAFYANQGLAELHSNPKKPVFTDNFFNNIDGLDEDDREDIDRIKKQCLKALDKSNFGSLKNILRKCYKTAQSGAIESALNTIEGVTDKLENRLSSNIDSCKKSKKELSEDINEIKNHSDIIRKFSRKIEDKKKDTTDELKEELKESLIEDSKIIKKSISEIIKKQFQNYHAKEAGLGKASKEQRQKLDALDNNEDALIKFGNKDDATKYIVKPVLGKSNQLLSDFYEKLNEKINSKIKENIDGIKEDLIEIQHKNLIKIEEKLGKGVKLFDHKVGLNLDKINRKEINLKSSIEKKVTPKTTDQDSFFGGIKRFFGSMFGSDWGTDTKSTSCCVVSQCEMNKEIDSVIQEAQKALLSYIDKNYEESVTQPFNNAINPLIQEIEHLLKGKKEILTKRTNKYSKETNRNKKRPNSFK